LRLLVSWSEGEGYVKTHTSTQASVKNAKVRIVWNCVKILLSKKFSCVCVCVCG